MEQELDWCATESWSKARETASWKRYSGEGRGGARGADVRRVQGFMRERNYGQSFRFCALHNQIGGRKKQKWFCVFVEAWEAKTAVQ